MRKRSYQEIVSIAAQQLAAESNGDISYSFYAAGNDLMLVKRAMVNGRVIEFDKHIRATPDGNLLCSDRDLIYNLEERVKRLLQKSEE